METKNVAFLVAAAVFGIIGVYVAVHVVRSAKPAPSIDDQLRGLQ